MRFMMIVKASKRWEAGKMPSEELIAAMGKYSEEMTKAGVLLDLAGLHPSSKGARIQFSGSERTVMDGPFAETKELIGGYWIIQVQSKEETLAWAGRAPAPHGEGEDAEIEIRQVCEPDEIRPRQSGQSRWLRQQPPGAPEKTEADSGVTEREER